MRFSSDAYDKVFPRKVETPKVETSVATFTPTEDLLNGTALEVEAVTDVETDSVDTQDMEGVDDGNNQHDM